MYLKSALQLSLTSTLLPLTPLNSTSPSTSPTPQSNTEPGYSINTPSTVSGTPHFGQNYAVLNLDLIDGLVSNVNETDAGKIWINATANWINAYASHFLHINQTNNQTSVHKLDSPPLNIYTRIYFTESWKPEVTADTPFSKVVTPLGHITASDPKSQIYPAFQPAGNRKDAVLRKSRYYAGDANSLEEILRVQGVDTVILVCPPFLLFMRDGGENIVESSQESEPPASCSVPYSDYSIWIITCKPPPSSLPSPYTPYRYRHANTPRYIISNNTLETSSNAQTINDIILTGILPKMPVGVISLEQAIAGIKRSASHD